jgi:hypothetical protein
LNDARRISAQCGILGENLVASKREQPNILRLRRVAGCLDAGIQSSDEIPADFITASRGRASGADADAKTPPS